MNKKMDFYEPIKVIGICLIVFLGINALMNPLNDIDKKTEKEIDYESNESIMCRYALQTILQCEALKLRLISSIDSKIEELNNLRVLCPSKNCTEYFNINIENLIIGKRDIEEVNCREEYDRCYNQNITIYK